MLSSCWFTTPFTGCFTSAVKGGAGSGMHEGGDGDHQVKISQPPPHQTRVHVNVNGTAGGGGGGGGGAHDTSDDITSSGPPAAGQQTTPRTPRKSKSMGRIHGGGGAGAAEVVSGLGGGGGGGAGEAAPLLPAAGSSSHPMPHRHHHHNIHHHHQQPPSTIPEQHEKQETQSKQASAEVTAAAAASAAPAPAPASTWHRGHRRVPSDGVAWRVSKGLEADRIIGGDNMMMTQGVDEKESKRTYKSEYRKKFRPFSQYQYVDGKFHKVPKSEEPAAGVASGGGSAAPAGAGPASGPGPDGSNWYKEVIELRKQAGQYRYRGWGVETASERLAEIYTKQAELWEQVSRRSSLQALSLAATSPSSRPITKAEKDIENSRRSSPVKHVSNSTSRERPNTAPPKPKPAAVHARKDTGDKVDSKASKDTTPRHHYERTTGAEDGLLITSPSRDKIEPIVPDEAASSRRSSRRTPPVTSPTKDGPSRRRSNRASSAARPPPAKDCRSSVAGGRSISVGPENRSPKRTSRPPSSHTTAPTTKPERRPRPTSLSTSARRKGTDALPHRPSSHDENKEAKKSSKAKSHEPSASPKKGEDRSKTDKKSISEEIEPKKDNKEKDTNKDSIKEGSAKDTSKEPIEAVKESTGRKSTPEPRFDPEKYEPVVKTPPEPTRVKSPDQVGKWSMVKSPDPVNWTVPLDTGKTFTVTHNIPEGESARGTPSSEHRHITDSRTRQTPEPTKISQGPLVGTPLAAVTSDTKYQPQEPAKSTPGAAVEPKVDDKVVEKKPDDKPGEKKLDDKTLEKKPDDKPGEKKLDDKTFEKKPEVSKKSDSPLVEPKSTDSKTSESKISESKIAEDKDTKITDPKTVATKVEPKPSDIKAPDVKSFDSKVDSKIGDVKSSDIKSLDSKVDAKISETKTQDSMPFDNKSGLKASDLKSDVKPSDSKVESLSDIKSTESKPSEFTMQESKPIGTKMPEAKVSESKGPETKQLEAGGDQKKPESVPDTKSSQSQQLPSQIHPSPLARKQDSPVDFAPPSSGAVDPMTMSMTGAIDPMTTSMSGAVDPMTMSMSGAVDPMSMSMFGSLNGMNGKSSGTPSPTKPEVPPLSESTKDESGPESKAGVRNIPGTNLRCLDDPSFMFDQPGQTTTSSSKPGGYKVLEAPMETSQVKPGGFRVLEAPEAPSDIKDLPDQSPTKPEAPVKPSPYRVLEAPMDPPARPKGSPYRVLEAPDAPYYPQAQTVGSTQESKPPSLVSPSSGRAVTDALDKARTRFDSFWGGPKDPPSNV